MIEPRRKPDNITYLLEALLDARTRGKKFVEIWIKKVEAYLADEVADLTQKGQNLNLEMERAMTGKVDQVLSINDTLQQMGILIKDMNISQVISCPALEKIRTQTKNVVDSARECVSNSTNSGIAKIKELVDKVKELHNEPDKITDQNCTHDIFGAPKPSGRVVGCIKDQLQNLINSIVIVLSKIIQIIVESFNIILIFFPALKKCSVETFKATINRLQEGIVQIGSCVTKYARDKLLGKIGF